MLLVANFASTKRCKNLKMIKALANGYSSESTQHELSNEYQYDRISMVFKNTLLPYYLDESSLNIGRVNVGVCSLTLSLPQQSRKA